MKTTRRDFIKASAVAGAGFLVASGISANKRANALESVAVAGVGVGGKGAGTLPTPAITAKSSRCAASITTPLTASKRNSKTQKRSSTIAICTTK